MRLDRVWLTDFRSYEHIEIELDDGLTAVVGANGIGKTNLLEAIGLLATLKSFRGAPTDSLIRRGSERAIIRAEGERDGRPVLIELELAPGKSRAQVNRQKLQRTRDLLGALRVTVFAPDDLTLVKDGPAVRRDFVDDLAVALDPKHDRTLSDFDRALRQRNALLRTAGGRLDESAELTLDVWDTQLAQLGSVVLDRRYDVLEQLVPLASACYRTLAADDTDLTADYLTSWSDGSLLVALTQSRDNDVRRGVSTVGPHRDEIAFSIDGFASRTEASQGEQRTLALALRLGGHRLVTDRIGEPPLLLLDDVLSELDPDRAHALLSTLPPGQTVITSAAALPAATRPDTLLVHDPSAVRAGGFVRKRTE
ncbi:MAG: DNA replication/repair protein RecF [Acidimicrobiales bacterium]